MVPPVSIFWGYVPDSDRLVSYSAGRPSGVKTPNEDQWSDLQRFIGTARQQPPTDFLLAVFAVISDPAKITGAITRVKMEEEETVWKSWVATDSAVAHVAVSFGAAHYDRETESDPYYRHQPPSRTLLAGQVRPLRTLRQIEFSGIGRRSLNSGTYLVDESTLTFEDGKSLTVPGQMDSHDQFDREAVDRFHEALRRNF